VTTGFLALISLRLLLGLGETAVFPCASKIFAGGLPSISAGAANGLVVSGTALGPAFGTFVGGKLMALMGWRPTFLIFGLTSLLWLAPGVALDADAPKAGGRGGSGGAVVPGGGVEEGGLGRGPGPLRVPTTRSTS
jgi:MFS family permease